MSNKQTWSLFLSVEERQLGSRSTAKTNKRVLPVHTPGVGGNIDLCKSGMSKQDEAAGLGEGVGHEMGQMLDATLVRQIVLCLPEPLRQQNQRRDHQVVGRSGPPSVSRGNSCEAEEPSSGSGCVSSTSGVSSVCLCQCFLGFKVRKHRWVCSWEVNSR